MISSARGTCLTKLLGVRVTLLPFKAFLVM